MMARMELGIEGRIAVVTGATRGIGAAVAERLAAEGARVVRVARSEGHRRHRARRRRADRRARRRAGRHPRQQRRHVGDQAARRARSTPTGTPPFELNVMAPMRLMRHFAPADGGARLGPDRQRHLDRRASARRRPGRPTRSPRPRSSRSRACTRTSGPRGACSSTRSRPGRPARRCGSGEGGLAEQVAARAAAARRRRRSRASAQKVPLGRFGEPDEVAAVVVFLCSERASWVTGAAWSADGGTCQSML